MTTINIIDPHLHLFDLALGNYGWLRDSNPPHWQDKPLIAKNFDQSHLELSLPLNLMGFVHIEAGFDNSCGERELNWLKETVSMPHKAIGVIDLTLPPADFKSRLSKMRQIDNFVGVRHILDEDALSILRHKSCSANFAELAKFHLIFECQYPVGDLESSQQVYELTSQYPDVTVILNHAGFPPEHTDSDNWTVWAQQLGKLATLKNIVVKCSGWEMTNRQYQQDWQQAVLMYCLQAFGEHRVMIASNFPLTLFSTSYQAYWHSMVELIEKIDTKLVKTLCYDNARQWYKL